MHIHRPDCFNDSVVDLKELVDAADVVAAKQILWIPFGIQDDLLEVFLNVLEHTCYVQDLVLRVFLN